jgi:HD superfamily phosphohydrolase
MHCDLHNDNILISQRIFAEGILIIDFGSGHRVSDERPETPDRGNPLFKNLRGQKQHRKTVVRTQSIAQFENYDYTALGKALAGMEDAFFSAAPHDQRLAFSEFCSMLQDGTPKTWTDVKDLFEHVVDPTVLLTRNDRLFVRRDGSRPRITVPGSTPVPVGDSVIAVINTPVFQRLRTIKQLSFCEWQYPGGTHTRFEHCLGVFGVTCRALEFLARSSVINSVFTQRNITGTLLASLVHDIGHYPFAHVIEHYAAAHFHEVTGVKASIHHFDHTLHLLDHDAPLKEVIAGQWGDDIAEEAKRVLEGKLGVLSQILDGAVDCDKIDYLKRDSLHCGVPYGNGFDVDEVLASFACSSNGDRLFVKDGLVHAVEGFMIVQDQMLSAIYWHPTVRAVFAMFHAFLAGLVGDDPNILKEIVIELKKCASDFEAVHHVFAERLKRQPLDGTQKLGGRSELRPLIHMHMEPNFAEIYFPVAKYSALDRINPKTRSPRNVFSSIVSPPGTGTSSLPIDWNMVRRLRTSFRRSFQERGATPSRFDILIDVPWGKNQSRSLTVVNNDTLEERAISEVWHLAPSIFNHPTAYSAPIRVFVAPWLYRQKEGELSSIRDAALEKYFDRATMKDDTEFT